MQTTELKVDGTTCGSCVASVTKALERVPGLQDIEVDLGGGIVRVHGEHAAQQAPELVAALGEVGHGAGAAASAPVVHQRPAGGCGAGAPSKARGGCCCG